MTRFAQSAAGLVNALRRDIAGGQAVVFVGAGLSIASGAPSWAEMAQHLRRSLRPPTDEGSPALIAQYVRNQCGTKGLVSHLRALFGEQSLVPTEAHRLLATLPLHSIFTTNYDDLIEQALRAAGRPIDVVMDPQRRPAARRPRAMPVVKLHGDLAHPSTLVCSDEDYTRLFAPTSRLRRRLMEALRRHPTIFIGYGMRDLDIPLLYSACARELSVGAQRRYLITFDRDPHFLELWRRRALTPVVLTPRQRETPHDAVTRLLRTLL